MLGQQRWTQWDFNPHFAVGEEPEKDDCKEKEKRSRQLTIEETILQRSDIKLKDVVGLVEAKQALQEAIIMPLVFPHLFLGVSLTSVMLSCFVLYIYIYVCVCVCERESVCVL